MIRFNMHYVQHNPDEYWQPYAVMHKEGKWCRWEDVESLLERYTIAIYALHNIQQLGGISRPIADKTLMKITEIEEKLKQ